MTNFGWSPDYSVKFYRDGLYKLVRFNHPISLRLPGDPKDHADREEEDKFSSSISRAKSVIYQVAVCNDWDWFVTFTIDPSKFNRYMFKPFYKAFSQWIRDYRKKYHCKIEYLLIPELHKDGAWHMHGLIRGIPADHITPFVPGIHPQKLIDKGYMNWGRYSKKFGFGSLGPIQDQMKVAGYVTKYITKDLLQSNNSFGSHLYMCSIGLRRAVSMGYVFGRYLDLDRYISSNGQFCDTGWVHDVDWSYFLPFLSLDETFDIHCFEDYREDTYLEFGFDGMQLSLFDREGDRYG